VPERFEAIWFDKAVPPHHLEFELLHCLIATPWSAPWPHRLILKEVWGYEPDDDIETIRVHVRHCAPSWSLMRAKPLYIKTVYGAGYCLELPIKPGWPSCAMSSARPPPRPGGAEQNP